MVLTYLQELGYSINQILDPQQAPHTSPWRAHYGVYFSNIGEKIHRVLTAPHCTVLHFLWNCPCANAKIPHWWLLNIASGEIGCCQARSHYLSRCWPTYMSPYCIKPQWVKYGLCLFYDINGTTTNIDYFEQSKYHVIFVLRNLLFLWQYSLFYTEPTST